MQRDEKKRVISDFLRKCNAYADDKLVDYQQRAASASGIEALSLQDKISHWTAYRAFNEHAITELETDTLDDWLD